MAFTSRFGPAVSGAVKLAATVLAVGVLAAGCSSAPIGERVVPTTSTSVAVIYEELITVKAGAAAQLTIEPAVAAPGDQVTVGRARPGEFVGYVWAGRFIDENLLHWEWAMEPSGGIDGPLTPDNQRHGDLPVIVIVEQGLFDEPEQKLEEEEPVRRRPQPVRQLWIEDYTLPADMIPGNWILCANGPTSHCGTITITPTG